jgi:hypothetical protein
VARAGVAPTATTLTLAPRLPHQRAMAKRRAAQPQHPPARTPAAQKPDADSASVLPTEIQAGDRFPDHGVE